MQQLLISLGIKNIVTCLVSQHPFPLCAFRGELFNLEMLISRFLIFDHSPLRHEYG